MNRYEELKNKVEDLVTLLEAFAAEVKNEASKVAALNSTKAVLEKSIVESRLTLKDLEGDVAGWSKIIKEKNEEAERLKNTYISKAQSVDQLREEIVKDTLELERKIKEADEAKAKYEEKFIETSQRYEDALAIEKTANENMEIAQNIERVTNIAERERSALAMNKKSGEVFKAASEKEEAANHILASIEQAKLINENMAKSLTKKTKDLEDNEKALKEKEDSFKSVSDELDSRKKAVEYLELRVNKIIREKNISDIING